ncbi:unnamed protein product [Cylicostephanus goldi]|uniref:Uncharacterized protein n=1 Tax=Cylicostephanus goldi TaxID=71465 RepID=A0A3P7QK89_CYLGO|nr:unnamed protein product [Cylicostephanus goldi]
MGQLMAVTPIRAMGMTSIRATTATRLIRMTQGIMMELMDGASMVKDTMGVKADMTNIMGMITMAVDMRMAIKDLLAMLPEEEAWHGEKISISMSTWSAVNYFFYKNIASSRIERHDLANYYV